MLGQAYKLKANMPFQGAPTVCEHTKELQASKLGACAGVRAQRPQDPGVHAAAAWSMYSLQDDLFSVGELLLLRGLAGALSLKPGFSC